MSTGITTGVTPKPEISEKDCAPVTCLVIVIPSEVPYIADLNDSLKRYNFGV
jgi:hypothetical protein